MIHLKTFRSSGYKKLISWIDCEESLMQFAGPAFTFPLTEKQLEESLNDKKRFAFSVINEASNDAVGHCEIYLAETSAYLGRILIGDKSLRGKGTGKKIVSLLLEHAFLNLNQSKIELNVFDWNIAAIKCYEKSGFVINPEKTIERKVNGKTWIAINMIIGKDNWQLLK